MEYESNVNTQGGDDKIVKEEEEEVVFQPSWKVSSFRSSPLKTNTNVQENLGEQTWN